jgi:hypothetical protein
MSNSINEGRGSLESRKDFKNTPSSQYKYWLRELNASEKLLRDFRKLGGKIVRKFTGSARKGTDISESGSRSGGFRLNLFHSNVITLQSMLYGNLPKVDVSRRHDDPSDDTGRVAALILQRLLNNDVQDNGKEYTSVLRAVLQDRLLPGLGCARIRYEVKPSADGNGMESEFAPIDYYHWRDVRWGWGRTFAEVPWIGFRAFLTKDEVEKRFGADVAKAVELSAQSVSSDERDEQDDSDTDSAWNKAEIWEIWDKKKRKVVWVSPGYDKVLDTKDDYLKLSGFYPCPPFLLANPTTSLYVPTSDYYMAQDLYNEIDILQTRISIITEAVKVVGVYDRGAEGVQRMFDEGVDNDLIPVDNWALFAEKGGIQGQIDWVPIEAVTAALDKLQEMRTETIALLQQVTGMSDIMRGQLDNQYEGVGQTQQKAKFSSVRVQALQDEFAGFAANLLQLKSEIIGRHFSPETISKFANLDETFDMDLVPGAIELIKNPEQARMRVEVRPESIAMVDYGELKQERTDFLTAIATFLQSAAPLMEAEPNSKPFVLTLMQWGLAGFKGSQAIEGVVDKFIEQSLKDQQEGGEEQEDDGTALEQMKSQAQMQLEQTKHQNSMALIQAKSQADMQLREADLKADIQTRQADSQAKQQEIIADMQAELAIVKAKLTADTQLEAQSSEINVLQNAAEVQTEMTKEAAKASMEIDKQEHATEMNIKEIKAQPKPEKPKDDKS